MTDEIENLRAENAQQQALIVELQTLVADLQRELQQLKNRSSKNSSQPPSLDFKEKKKPGSKGGGVKGHEAHQRSLSKADEVISLTVHQCPHCKGAVRKLPDEPSLFEYVEMVEWRCKTTHYQRDRYYCSGCRRRFRAPLPKGVGSSNFGPKLQAAVGLITGRYHLSKREASSLFREICGVHLCSGVISKIESRISSALKEPYEEIKESIRSGSSTTYIDETGWRHAAQNHYVWQASNSVATLTTIEDSRCRMARDELIGTEFSHPVVTDRYVGYADLSGPHQHCLAHIARDFRKFSECEGITGYVGKELLEHLRGAFKTWKTFRKESLSLDKLRNRTRYRSKRIESLLYEGMHSGTLKFQRFCKGLLNRFENLWMYLKIEGMHPTNNQAERELRPLVLWRKRSNGTRGTPGLYYVSRISSVVQTLQRQKRSVFDFLSDVLYSRAQSLACPKVLG